MQNGKLLPHPTSQHGSIDIGACRTSGFKSFFGDSPMKMFLGCLYMAVYTVCVAFLNAFHC